jgi:hypothetical protein
VNNSLSSILLRILPVVNTTRKERISIAILISVAVALSYSYFYQVDRPHLDGRLKLHNQILEGTAESPYRYRVLAPFSADILTNTLSPFLVQSKAFLISYALIDIVSISALLLALFLFLKIWFPIEYSLIGALFAASTMVIAFRDHYFQPWSLLEAAIFSFALLFIFNKKYLILGLTILIATLNRETALFIPFIFLFTNFDFLNSSKGKPRIRKETILLFIAFFSIWAVTYTGIRLLIGSTGHMYTVKELWIRNTYLSNLIRSFLTNGLFLGFFWIFAGLGFKAAPKFIKQATLIIPFYLTPIIIFGNWYEVRLLMPLYPILIPLGLSYIYRQK